jgi:hypothetical protein
MHQGSYLTAAIIANMRYGVAGLVLLAGAVWIAVEAFSSDDYYAPDDVTRWEHASSAGSAPIVVGGEVVAASIGLAFLLQGLLPRLRLRAGSTLGGLVVYVVAWGAAWIALMGGH